MEIVAFETAGALKSLALFEVLHLRRELDDLPDAR
jgi:hypothetical protein